ncbi:MAG: hypothetical protein CM15mP12_8240 [Gammaproteobacteria bacterium]|nr:MAG: hypothetical protein CM15mP12_8240 [Gammaproteobacteria bacterium]
METQFIILRYFNPDNLKNLFKILNIFIKNGLKKNWVFWSELFYSQNFKFFFNPDDLSQKVDNLCFFLWVFGGARSPALKQLYPYFPLPPF